MADDKYHVHFTLSPDNPREKKAIDILESLPNRQTKSYFMSLLEGQGELLQMAAEVHALAVHFGVGLEVGLLKSTSIRAGQQLPGQVSIEDVDDLAPIDTTPEVFKEDAAPELDVDTGEEPAADAAENTGDMPDDVMDFIGGLNEEWN